MECLKLEILDELCGFDFEVDREVIDKKITNILTKYEIRLVSEIPSTDIVEKIEAYLAAKKIDGLSPKTLLAYRYTLNKFAKYAKKNIDEIDANDVRLFISQWKVKTSTVSTKISQLKSFFKWLFDEEFVKKIATGKIKNPKKEKRLPKSLSIDELETVRESCITKRERALIEVFYATGARLSEIEALNRDDIDYSTRSVKVFGKGSKERTVYFSFKAMHHLNNYLNTRTDDNEALFITSKRPFGRLGHRSIQEEFNKIEKRANIKSHLHPHAMRHTLATQMLNNGAPISAVQAILGHSDPGTTQIYAQMNEKIKHESYLKFHVQ